MVRWIVLPLLVLAACNSGRDVQIEVAIPGPDSVDAPVAHLRLVALPYDRDSVMRTFESGNPRPAELSRRLDSLFARFRGPFTSYAAAAYRVQSLERTLGQLKLRLDSLPRSSPVYDSLYRRFATVSDSTAEARRRRDDVQRDLAAARNRLSPAIDSLRQRMARWEDSTYHGYDSITRSLGTGIGREPIADSTDDAGKVTLRLPRGAWWIYARSWDAWDPYSEWYWNVPVTSDRIVLDRRTGRRLPRY